MKRKGFSYIEIIIALAVFSIGLLPLLPILSQAYLNEFYSREAYVVHLHAQGIMAVARDAVMNGLDIEECVEEYVKGLESPPYAYEIWYDDSSFASRDGSLNITPNYELNGFEGKVITVVCQEDDEHIYSRVVGVVPSGISDE